MSSYDEEKWEAGRTEEPEEPEVTRAPVQIKFGDGFFYSDEDYDAVVRKITDGVPLDVYESFFSEKNGRERVYRRICFFADVDWVAIDL